MLDMGHEPEAPPPRDMLGMEATFEKLENELKEVITNSEALKKTFLELSELKHILLKAQNFFDEVRCLHFAYIYIYIPTTSLPLPLSYWHRTN